MKIVIVGGGTAGWISAMYLANLNVRADGFKPYEITVIESPNIPIIGAGEGSTGALVGTLKEKLRKFGKPGQNMTNHFIKRSSEFTNTNIKELYNQNTVIGMVNVIKRVLKFENKSNKSTLPPSTSEAN